jgi:hypothetical protein
MKLNLGLKTGMIMPTININGSDPQIVLELYQQALDALDRCAATLGHARHGRDYQNMPIMAQVRSVEQFTSVALKLRGVRDYIDDHVSSISEQIDERNSTKGGQS